MRTYIKYLFVLLSGVGFAQQRDSVKQKDPGFIIKFTHGMNNRSEFDFTTAQWEKMTPGFQIPDSLKPISPKDYHGNIHSFTNDSYYMLSFSLINNRHKQADKKYRTTTTFHLGYGPHLSSTKRWASEERQIIDTLHSSQTGMDYYVTGVRRKDVVKMYRAQSILVGVGQHFATNPNRIFQFETGVDFLCYMSIVSQVDVSYSDFYTVENAPDQYLYQQPVTDNPIRESYSSKFLAGMLVRVPLDFSFKLSKKSPIASRMRIGMELNPGMATQFTESLITTNFNLSGGMNFRFAF